MEKRLDIDFDATGSLVEDSSCNDRYMQLAPTCDSQGMAWLHASFLTRRQQLAHSAAEDEHRTPTSSRTTATQHSTKVAGSRCEAQSSAMWRSALGRYDAASHLVVELQRATSIDVSLLLRSSPLCGWATLPISRLAEQHPAVANVIDTPAPNTPHQRALPFLRPGEDPGRHQNLDATVEVSLAMERCRPVGCQHVLSYRTHPHALVNERRPKALNELLTAGDCDQLDEWSALGSTVGRRRDRPISVQRDLLWAQLTAVRRAKDRL